MQIAAGIFAIIAVIAMVFNIIFSIRFYFKLCSAGKNPSLMNLGVPFYLSKYYLENGPYSEELDRLNSLCKISSVILFVSGCSMAGLIVLFSNH